MTSARNASVWAQRIGIGVVVALVAVLALRVGSSSSQSVELRDLTVWLPSTSTGEVVLAHAGSGSRGEVVARIKAANAGEQLVVVQNHAGSVVLNRTSREVGVVDGITLTMSQKAPLEDVDATSQLVWSAVGSRVVTSTGVYRLDPANGIPVGSAKLGSPLSSVVADADGTVYGVNGSGQVIAVGDSANPVSLPENAEPAGLVVASGHAFVVDRQSQQANVPTLHGLSGARVTGRSCLSGAIPANRAVVSGGSTAADEEIAVVADASGGIRITDLRHGTCASVQLPPVTPWSFGQPVVANGFVYLPVMSASDSQVIVVNAAEGTTVGQYSLGIGGRTFDLVENDGTVWFNDPTGSAAGVLGRDAVMVRVDKSAVSATSAAGPGNSSGRSGSGSSASGPTGRSGATSGPSGAIVSGATGRSGAGGETGVADPSGSPSSLPGTNTVTAPGANVDPGAAPSGTTPRTGLNADFTYSARSVKVGQSVRFADTSSGNPTAWTWEFGDGTFATGPNVNHSWDQPGVFTVTLRVESPAGSSRAGVAITVIAETARAKPEADFRFNASRVEVGQPVTFTDRSAGEPTEWQWNFGDGSGASGASVSHVYRVAGSYEATLTATNAEGSDTSAAAVITVFDKVEPPIAAIGGGLVSANTGQQVTYTSRSTGNPTTLQWSFGDGSSASGPTVQHAWTKGGNYVVTLSVSNSAGSNSITSAITVSDVAAVPVSRFTISQATAEEGQTLRFQSLSINGPTQLQWDFGDGATATGASATHAYSRVGTYTVSLRAASGVGNDTSTQTVTVVAQLPAPVAAFSFSPSSITTNTAVVFTDESSGGAPGTWSWDFGDGTPAVAQKNPTHMFERVGTYPVRLTVTNTKGTSSLQRNVTVLPAAPEASFSFAPIAPLAGAAVQFTDTSTGGAGTSWSWDFGDNTPVNNQRNPSHAFAANGSYQVRLTVKNDTGQSIWIRQVDVSPLAPVARFDFTPAAPTTATPVVFRNTSTGGEASTIRWDFGDSTQTSSLASPSHTYAAPGSYRVVLTMSNATDRSTAETTVVVTVPPPVVSFTASAPAIAGTAVTFTNTSTGGPFISTSWNFDDNTALSTLANPTHTFAAAGTYNVRLTVTNGGGPASVTVPVTVAAAINATFSVNPAVPRAGTAATFASTTAGVGASPTYTWTFEDGGTGTGPSVSHTFAAAGTYDVTLVVVATSGATSSRTTAVKVDPAVPVASFTYAAAASPARTVTFTNTTPAIAQPFVSTWRWGDGSPDVVSAGPVTHTFVGAATSSMVRLTVVNDSGTNAATNQVSLVAPTAAFSASVSVGRTVTFTNSSTGGPFAAITWEFDDGTPAFTTTSTAAFAHTFPESKSYAVTLTVRTGQGTDSVTHAVLVIL